MKIIFNKIILYIFRMDQKCSKKNEKSDTHFVENVSKFQSDNSKNWLQLFCWKFKALLCGAKLNIISDTLIK